MCRLPQSLVLMATILAWTEPRTAASALLIVPDQYPTIHSAVTAASSGDSILIRAGTYVDSLSWSGKDLTLLGESGAAEVTTNGTGRVLDLGAGVTLATVLEGLVISHGLADEGGGLRLRDGAAATIRHCRFTRNSAHGNLVAYGGGVLMDSQSSAVMEDCSFAGNHVSASGSPNISGVGEGIGGAIAAGAATHLIARRCSFEHNGAAGFEGGAGAAIATNGVANIDSCTFSDNAGGAGPGINSSGGCLTVTRSWFERNHSGYGASAIEFSFGSCAGTDAPTQGGSFSIVENVFFDNYTGLWSTIHAEGPGEIRSNTLAFNWADDYGAAIAVTAIAGCSTVTNNIVALNHSYGISCSGTPSPGTIACNDVWMNELNGSARNYGGDCPDETGQFGNISLDPLFCSAVARHFTINERSPCALDSSTCGLIGALGVGCPDSTTSTLVTLFSVERVAGGVRVRWRLAERSSTEVWLERAERSEGPWSGIPTQRRSEGDVTVEMDSDALEGRPYWYRLMARESAGAYVLAGPIEVAAGPGDLFALPLVVPSPGPGPVTIEFVVARRAPIRIDVLDIQGRAVATPARGIWPAGRHVVQWSGETGGGPLSSGLYFVSYRFPGGMERRRVVLTR